MKLITEPQEAHACIMDICRERPRSAGNIARKMMGAGLLKNEQAAYDLVNFALEELLAKGCVTKHGNGKSVHWYLSPREFDRLGEDNGE